MLPTALPFTSAISSAADRDSNGVISNWEFYLSLDPNSVSRNDYVFDHFEWDHCTDGAIDISAVSNSKLNTATKAHRVLDSAATASSGVNKASTAMNGTTTATAMKATVILDSNFAFAVVLIILALAVLALIWSQSGLSGDGGKNNSVDDEVRYDSEVQPLLNQSSSFAPHTRM